MSVKEIKLNKEQAEKFLMCFFEDVKRLAIERQKEEKQIGEKAEGAS